MWGAEETHSRTPISRSTEGKDNPLLLAVGRVRFDVVDGPLCLAVGRVRIDVVDGPLCLALRVAVCKGLGR